MSVTYQFHEIGWVTSYSTSVLSHLLAKQPFWPFCPISKDIMFWRFCCSLLVQGGSSRQRGRRARRRAVTEEWEILEGLKSGQQFDVEPPAKFGGYIMKSRKWPMKGWHKVRRMLCCWCWCVWTITVRSTASVTLSVVPTGNIITLPASVNGCSSSHSLQLSQQMYFVCRVWILVVLCWRCLYD